MDLGHAYQQSIEAGGSETRIFRRMTVIASFISFMIGLLLSTRPLEDLPHLRLFFFAI